MDWKELWDCINLKKILMIFLIIGWFATFLGWALYFTFIHLPYIRPPDADNRSAPSSPSQYQDL